MELDIKRERITDSVSKRRAVGKDLGGPKDAIYRPPYKECSQADRVWPASQAGRAGFGNVQGYVVPPRGSFVAASKAAKLTVVPEDALRFLSGGMSFPELNAHQP